MTAKRKKTAKATAKPDVKKQKAPAKPPEKLEAADTHSNGLSRNELMLEAKTRSIKNFRILNKQELIEILKDGTTQERASEIVAGAIARWKNGWGTGKPREKTQI